MTNSVENRGLQLIFEESKKNPLVYMVVKKFTYILCTYIIPLIGDFIICSNQLTKF